MLYVSYLIYTRNINLIMHVYKYLMYRVIQIPMAKFCEVLAANLEQKNN
jgi:hypothetical protein